MLVDIDRQEKWEEMLARKFEAIVVVTLGTTLPCLLAGALVGVVLKANFWSGALD